MYLLIQNDRIKETKVRQKGDKGIINKIVLLRRLQLAGPTETYPRHSTSAFP